MMKNRRFLLSLLAATTIVWMPSAGSAAEQEQGLKVGKKGDVTFRQETKVGEMTFKPGRYRFQHRVEGDEHFVHFTEWTQPYAPGGAAGPVAHPGEVRCRIEPLGKKASQTAVYTISEGGARRVTKVVVRGENVAHIF